jgi:hypothetical protein
MDKQTWKSDAAYHQFMNQFIYDIVGMDFDTEQQEDEYFRNTIKSYRDKGGIYILGLVEDAQRIKQDNREYIRQKKEAEHMQQFPYRRKQRSHELARQQRLLVEAAEARYPTPPNIIVASNKCNEHDILSIILADKYCINDVDRSGNTALHLAASRNDLSIVKMLLFYGANTSIANNAGKLAADMAGWCDVIQCIRNV